jgi:2-methylcitrate dehydratase PrpD
LANDGGNLMSEVLSEPPAVPAATAEISRRLCEQAARLHYDDLPPEVVRMVKLFLGVIGGAADAPGIAEVNGRLTKWEQGGRATGLIGRRAFAPPAAALANGAAAHALDFDDMHDPARVHAYCVMLPTLLATAEDLGQVRGRDFILALALAVELHARLGLTCSNCLGRGWHPTMLLGVLAGAIGAGRLLRLDEDRLLHALGLAHHFAAGSAQSMLDGALGKRLGAGFAARSAVMAAFFAADGITGPYRPLEGNAGLFKLQERGEVEPERLLAGFGSEWEVLNFGFKAYPCCRCNHTTIGLALEVPTLERPPFFALGPVRSYVVFTDGGLRVSERLEVLRADGETIPGLYAAGSAGQGGLLLEGHGRHLGWAFISGRIAGRHAALDARPLDSRAAQ